MVRGMVEAWLVSRGSHKVEVKDWKSVLPAMHYLEGQEAGLLSTQQ